MVSQKGQVAYGLLVGMTLGMLFSAYQSLHGTGPAAVRSARSLRVFDRPVTTTKGLPLLSTRPTDSFLVKKGILAESTGAGSETEALQMEEGKVAKAAVGEVPVNEPLPRVCGSPAIDGYAHVKPECLEASPTAKAWQQLHPEGGRSGEGLECNTEYAVSIDGLAVGWGIDNKKSSPEECCQACRDHVPGPDVGGPFQSLPCNAWVYCPEDVCFEADAHHHTKGDCWLKFTEAPQNPEINARGDFSEEFRRRHPEAPERCPWVSGVLLPPGQVLTNGTWGPRYSW